MKLLFLFLICFFVTIAYAKPVDFTVLNEVPGLRAKAYQRMKPTLSGSSGEIETAAVRYFEDLSAIIVKLRNTYYSRLVVPDGYSETLQVSDDLLASINKMAVLLTNIETPSNVAAGGCSGYPAAISNRRIKLAEMVILRMSKAIVSESYDWEKKDAPRTAFDYRAWLAAWYSSADEIPISNELP